MWLDKEWGLGHYPRQKQVCVISDVDLKVNSAWFGMRNMLNIKVWGGEDPSVLHSAAWRTLMLQLGQPETLDQRVDLVSFRQRPGQHFLCSNEGCKWRLRVSALYDLCDTVVRKTLVAVIS